MVAIVDELPGEEWRAVPDFPYEVSSMGRVRRGYRVKALRVATHNGYVYVDLYRTGDTGSQRFTFRLQKLVAMVFLGPKPEGCSIHHRDFDRTNNAASNLEYIGQAINDGTHQDPLYQEWIESPWDEEWSPGFEEWKTMRAELELVPF